MWTGWGFFGLVMIISNRYLKHLWWLHMWIHRIAGSIILLITFIMGFLALKNMADPWEIEVALHNLIGFSILCVVLLVVMFGVFTRSMMNRMKWKTKSLIILKYGHKVSQKKINSLIDIRLPDFGCSTSFNSYWIFILRRC